jgi:hypothetical protein
MNIPAWIGLGIMMAFVVAAVALTIREDQMRRPPGA